MALDNFLKRFVCKDPKEHNYTKIASQKLNIFGGSFTIPSSDVDDFYRVYTKHVFEERKQAYLTEKQLDEGPILIDLDFRYDSSVEERQHTKEHIVDFIQLVLENINKIVEPAPLAFSEVQGEMMIKYQEFLENEWVRQLKEKYSVKIDNIVLEEVKKKLENE